MDVPQRRLVRWKTPLTAAGLSFSSGVIIWMLFAAKSLEPVERPGWYSAVLLALAGVSLSVLFARTDPLIGASLMLGPLLLAGYTTPRGDDDGLWVFVFPMLVVLGGAIIVAGVIAGAITRARRKSPTPLIPEKVAIRLVAVLSLVTVFTVWLRWPSPWESFASAHEDLTIPQELTLVEEERSGSALSSFAPALVVRYRTDVTPEAVCPLLMGTGPFKPATERGFPCSLDATISSGGRLERVKIRVDAREFDPYIDPDVPIEPSAERITLVTMVIGPASWSAS